MRFRAPANVQLRRAHLVLMLAGLVPTGLMAILGIVVLVAGSGSVNIVVGVLVLTFCTSAVTGYILGSIFLSKGASVARFQNDYLSTVSHELNTPITSIRLFIETLGEDDRLDPDERRKCLQLLNQEMVRLEGMVARLFELSRIEAGQHRFAREPVNAGDLVQDALSSFDAATLTNPVEVAVTIEDGLIINGDHTALTSVLNNLLTNAWKYTPETDKEIGLEVRAHGRKHVDITVTDNGIGVPRQEQRHIFDKFERGSKALNSPARGSGLGLAVVRAIVQGHKGKIELKSGHGHGSEFRIRLRRVVD